MDLENMRTPSDRMLTVTCAGCGHEADVNVDRYPADRDVQSFANVWPCSQCGAKKSTVMPAWNTGSNKPPQHP